MSLQPTVYGDLSLGHILIAAGVENLADVLIIRHTYRDDGLRSPSDATPERLMTYTREQDAVTPKFPKEPPRLWLVFMADGGRRSRLLAAFDNRGEAETERTTALRYFDLQDSDLLRALRGRLVIEWTRDTINWTKGGKSSGLLPVVEIADPQVVPFPGFDRVLITHSELQAVVADSRYAPWRTALGAVQGIYLIADASTGKLYVGKADGGERILGRWSAYARDGHGGNVAMRELADVDTTHRQHLMFSILRVFGPTATTAEVDEAEAHFKRAMLTRQYGLNRN